MLIIAVEMAKKNTKIYTVGQVNSLIKGILENNLPSKLTIAGEITDLRLHHSGHCYFSLKDASSIIPCVMWKSKFGKVNFECKNGMAVLGTGSIEVYQPHGRYQFMIDKIELGGIGALRVAFEQMYGRLQAEGLFDEAHKKTLPRYPMRIGIVTSQSGAAVGDIENSIRSRWPCTKLFLYPAAVQGEGAAEKIATVIADINRRNKELKLDILIVGRGGGALEDLWAFNEEILARAIYNSLIPIISAVGHEFDTTIADLVADARASTPTKAGFTAVPDITEVLEQLTYFEKSLEVKARTNLALCKKSMQAVLAREVFRNPLLAIRNREQQLDEINTRLDSIRRLVAAAKMQLYKSYEQIIKIEPHQLLGKRKVDLSDWQNRADTGIKAVINKGRMQLTAAANRLAGLNPKAVLQRGYSITTNKKTGLLIRKLEDVQIGDLLTTELAEEKLVESKVTKK